MAIDAIGTTNSATSTPQAANIGQDDFLRIMLTQLRFQDPLKPVDNQQFVAQLAQFSALEINRQQSEKIDTLLTIDGANQAIGLLGKSVEAGSALSSNVGDVTAVSFSSGQPLLTVKTATTTLVDVKLSDVSLVR
ncbi:MAG: flagellar hook capping FlgD N-terminal domain-containing protein [Gammaproteobacteria bacterium]